MWIHIQIVPESTKNQKEQTRDAKLYELRTPEIPYATQPSGSPQYCGEAVVDIIAVHGLDSDPETGWSRKRPDGKRFPWLREKLPKDMPDARILSFSYPSSFYGDPTYTSIDECAKQLLREIVRDRRHAGRVRMCPTRKKRPIIFLGHSFGGLVIKKALLIANEIVTDRTLHETKEGIRERQNYQDFLAAVGGLFFFGTPHKGSRFSHWGQMRMFLGSMCGQATYPELIKLLRTHSLELHDMQHDFKRMYRGDKLAQTLLYCYYEMKGVPLYPYIVVDRTSACITDAECRGFNLTHKELNKFKEDKDPNYDQLFSDLTYALENSAHRIAKSFTPGTYGTTGASEASKAVEVALKPATGQLDQLRTRLSYRRDTPESCLWIHDNPKFKRWISNSPNLDLFWIYGKGGAGKSVLAAYIIDWLRSNFGRFSNADYDDTGLPICRTGLNQAKCGYIKQRTTVLFFLFGVNRSNQHVISFLGTLAHQLLSIHYDNDQLFATARSFVDERVRKISSVEDQEGKLIILLTDMLKLLGGPAYIIIDGVEENSEDNQGILCIKALNKLKRALSPQRPHEAVCSRDHAKPDTIIQLHILVISQFTSSISFAIQDTLSTREELDIAHFTGPDIASFVMTKSDDLVKQKPQLKEGKDKIMQSLVSGAQGMFQWVNGAIELLQRYAGDLEDIDKYLGNLPPTLTQTWEKVFMRLPSGNEAIDAQRKIRLALKLLTISARPLSAAELYYAYTIGTTSFEGFTGGSAQAIMEEVKRLLNSQEGFKDNQCAVEHIRGLLDSLVEFDMHQGTVQLAHDSVRKALLLPDEIQDQAAHTSVTEQLRLAGYQFTERDAQSTATELCLRIVQHSTLSHATSFTATPIPFVEYCWDHWKYHIKRSSPELGIIFDQMIRGVSRDAIAFLGALTEFVAQDMPHVGGRYSDLEYVLCLKRARECLLPAIETLTIVKKEAGGEISKSLNNHRSLFLAADEVTIPETRNSICDKHVRWWYEKVRGRFMPKASTVIRLRVDAIFDTPMYRQLKPKSSGTAALLQAARDLRTVALCFSVNPVYGALISGAGGSTFSPIHPLVYVASLFEECGSASCWDKLSSNWDPIDPFICNDDDPQAGPARFVLQCFSWREIQDQIPANSESNRQYQRAVSRMNARMDPDGRQLLRVSTENREQVKRLHGLSGSQYMTSYTFLELFGGDSSQSFTQTFIYNPIAQHHLRSDLLLNEHGSYLSNMFEDPKLTLVRHAPASLAENPVKEVLESIPNFLKLCFAKYIALLFEVFGNVAARAITAHVQQMEEAAQGIQLAWLHVQFLWETANWTSLSHIILAIVLFCWRNRYFPSVGGHYLDNPWARLRVAIQEPASYLQSQHHFAWWYFARAVSTSVLFTSLTAYLSALGMEGTVFFRELRTTYPVYVAHTYAAEYSLIAFTSFMHLCSLHRSLISVLYLLGTIIASGYVMTQDQTKIYSIFTFTVWYWYYSFLGIFNQVVLAASLEAFGGKGSFVFLLSLIPQYYTTKLLGRYEFAVARALSWPFKPLVWTGKLVWMSFLYGYVKVLQAVAILFLGGLVLLSFYWLRQMVRDPYNIEGTVRQLRRAAQLAGRTLKESELRHIGRYPLGGELEDKPKEQPGTHDSFYPPQPTPVSYAPHDSPDSEPVVAQGSAHTTGHPSENAALQALIRARVAAFEASSRLTATVARVRAAAGLDTETAPNQIDRDQPTTGSIDNVPKRNQNAVLLRPYGPLPPKASIPPPPKARPRLQGHDPTLEQDSETLDKIIEQSGLNGGHSSGVSQDTSVRKRSSRQIKVGWQ